MINSKMVEEAANQQLIANNLEHFATVYWHLHNAFLTLLLVTMENHNPISAAPHECVYSTSDMKLCYLTEPQTTAR